MAWNGSGTFIINSTGQPVVAKTVISSTVFNALTADIATGLTNCITKDGQQTITANIPWGSNKITGLASGTTNGDAVAYGQVIPYAAEASIASASTTDIGSETSNVVLITGNTTITSFGLVANCVRFCRVSSTPQITRNSSSLETPTEGNIQCSVGDTFIATSDSSGNWRIRNYQFGTPAPAVTTFSGTSIGSNTQLASLALSPGTWRFTAQTAENGGGVGDEQIGISTNIASFSGLTYGQNYIGYACDSTGKGAGLISAYVVTITSNTTYYLNGLSTVSGSSCSGMFRADRVLG